MPDPTVNQSNPHDEPLSAASTPNLREMIKATGLQNFTEISSILIADNVALVMRDHGRLVHIVEALPDATRQKITQLGATIFADKQLEPTKVPHEGLGWDTPGFKAP